MKKIINVPRIGEARFKQWTKTVASVDTKKTTGYAFEGEFIFQLAELHVGTYMLAFGSEGTRAKNTPLVVLYRVTTDGLEEVYRKEKLSVTKWALEVRDDIAQIINEKQENNPLENFSTSTLIVELKRRGKL